MRKTLTQLIPVGFVLFVTLAVIGCRSYSPPVSFYTLTPVAAKMSDSDQDALKDISIGIGPITFPKTLERPQIVTRPTANTLILSEFDRWGGDLKQDFLNVLTQNISMMTGSDQVFKSPLSDGLKPAYRVTLDVYQFDGRLGESVVLNVSWVLKNTQAGTIHSVFKKSVIRQVVSGNGYDALVQAQSDAIKTLSRAIVDEIKLAGE